MAPRNKFNEANLEAGIAAEAALLMQQLSTSDLGWDFLVVGDGSGTGWNQPCGWAAIGFDRHLGLHKRTSVGMDCGTSYLAELMPYVHILSWYLEVRGREVLRLKRRDNPKAALNIHIVTDNETVARQGRCDPNVTRDVGDYYWAMFDAMENNRGVAFSWHHRARLTTGMNRLCDHLAGNNRRALAALMPAAVR